MELLAVGCDPEVFAVDLRGRPVPLCGLVGGTKKDPIPVKGGTIQEDNVMAEIGITPAKTKEEFITNINDVMEVLHHKFDHYSIRMQIQESMTFNRRALLKKQARTVGCDPDMNAYTEDWNEIVGLHETDRYGAGHLHMSWENPSMVQRINLVKFLDLYIGLPQVLLTQPSGRRFSYGRAGNFRPKEYGVEYRTPSNFWLKDDTLKGWAYEQVQRAAAIASEFYGMVVSDVFAVRAAINEHDANTAARLIKKYNIQLP